MVQIPGGSFQMGKDLGTAATGDVTPVHTVILTGFSIGKYEVTQAQYQAVMGSNPSKSFGVGDNYPVYYICWYDTLVFCNKLSMAEGLTPAYRIKNSTDPAVWGTEPDTDDADWNAAEIVSGSTGYRLPTEAQWEYTAKGGDPATSGWVGYTYSGSDTVGDVAWYGGNSDSKTHEVGKKAPNKLGLYDMSGNVWELCWDRYGSYSSDSQTNPTGTVSNECRPVRRGGGWYVDASTVRSVYRYGHYPDFRGDEYGFRLVRP
jgi:formylglycine-generating enzyme required for sulfatase activity